MKQSRCLALCLFLFAAVSCLPARTQPNAWCFMSPVPGAQYVPVGAQLIFRADHRFPQGTDPRAIRVSVVGEKSGAHAGSLRILDDRETMTFTPASRFLPAETVAVSVDAGALGIAPLEYRFTVSDIAEYDPRVFDVTSDEKDARMAKAAPQAEGHSTMSVINGVAVPAGFPSFSARTLNDRTAPGKIFIGNWSWSGDAHYMMILENDGTPYYYKKLPNGHTRDLKLQPTGTLTRRVYDDLTCFVEMDSQFVNIDTLRCRNGYVTDEHEVQLTPNHHSFLIGLDYHQVDMSKLVSGGNANATVIGNTVQEQDEHHNVVFEWRSWDHFSIVDAVHEPLTNGTIDYVHMNSIAIDYDSNIVISSRHLSEITKIDRKTGAIIWRLGGAHNQFRFVNDAYGPSYQHDARPVPGKPNAYTMMDNGNFHSPAFSRAVEFQLYPESMTAVKVWEYRHAPSDYYTYFMGNVQRLPNGNTLIDWGDAPLPKATEVMWGGEVVYEANFDKSAYCYRTYRFEWENVMKIPYLIAESSPEKVTLIFNKFGDRRVKRYIVYGGTSPGSRTPIDSTTQTWIDLQNLTSGQTYYFRVTARDSSGAESAFSNEEKVLVRIYVPGSNLVLNGTFAQGLNNWQFGLFGGGAATSSTQNGEYSVAITNGGTQNYSVQLYQAGIPLVNGRQYTFEFDAYASASRTIDALMEQNGGSYLNYSRSGTMALSKTKTHKSIVFTMTNATDNDARVTFNMGNGTGTVYLANVSVKQTVTASADDTTPVPAAFGLDQNYPNPFNPSTTLRYHLPGGAERYRVSLAVFDLLGRQVASLEDGEKTSGAYEAQWDASACAGGMYFCRLSARAVSGGGTFQAVRKVVLQK